MAIKTGIALGALQCGATAITVTHEGYLYKLDTTQAFGVTLAGAGDIVTGILGDSQKYAVGDPINLIGTPGDIVQIKAGTAGFAIGDYIKSDASGLGVTASASDGYCAQALQTATSGQLGWCIILQGTINSSVSMWTRSGTVCRVTTAGDTIATGNIGTAAAIINLTTNTIATAGTGTNIDLNVTCKGNGDVKFTNGSLTSVLIPWCVVQPVIGTTGTGGTIGRITNASVTANSVVLVTAAEAITGGLGYVIPGSGFFTVYDAAGTGLDTKKVAYMIAKY